MGPPGTGAVGQQRNIGSEADGVHLAELNIRPSTALFVFPSDLVDSRRPTDDAGFRKGEPGIFNQMTFVERGIVCPQLSLDFHQFKRKAHTSLPNFGRALRSFTTYCNDGNDALVAQRT